MNTTLITEHIKNIRGLVDNLDSVCKSEIDPKHSSIAKAISQRMDDIRDRLLETDNEVANLKQAQES